MAETKRMTVEEVVAYLLEGEGWTFCASRWARVRVGALEAVDAGCLTEDLGGGTRPAAADREQEWCELFDQLRDLTLELCDRVGEAAFVSTRRASRPPSPLARRRAIMALAGGGVLMSLGERSSVSGSATAARPEGGRSCGCWKGSW